MRALRLYLMLVALPLLAGSWSCGDSVLGSENHGKEGGGEGFGAGQAVDCGPASKVAQDGEGGGEHSGGGEGSEGSGGEHSSASEGGGEGGEGGEGSSEGGGEESTTQYARADTFDQVRAGARLVIGYNEQAGAFIGSVENTTAATLVNVRVEIHLNIGLELGPTTPVDLAPGETAEIILPVPPQARDFTSYAAHPEVGSQGQDSGTYIEDECP